MVNKLCGIIKRAWYLFAVILSVSLVVGSGFYLIQGFGYVTDPELLSQLNQGRAVPNWDLPDGYVHSNSDVIGNLIAGLLVLPMAYAIHKAVRWVFFG
jgi:hypothetical protein